MLGWWPIRSALGTPAPTKWPTFISIPKLRRQYRQYCDASPFFDPCFYISFIFQPAGPQHPTRLVNASTSHVTLTCADWKNQHGARREHAAGTWIRQCAPIPQQSPGNPPAILRQSSADPPPILRHFQRTGIRRWSTSRCRRDDVVKRI